MSVLIYAEHDGSAVLNASLSAVAAARELDPDVHLLICGETAGARRKLRPRSRG